MAPQLWLITGAFSGFGALFAENALKAGHHVLATARNLTKAVQDYPQVASLGGQVAPTGCDEQVEQAIQATGGKTDVIINNAGYGLLGSIEDIRYASEVWSSKLLHRHSQWHPSPSLTTCK